MSRSAASSTIRPAQGHWLDEADRSLAPLDDRDFTPAQARHLLWRAGFGGTIDQVETLHRMGLQRAVQHLVDYQLTPDDAMPAFESDPDIIRPPTDEERALFRRARQTGDEKLQERVREIRRKQRRADRDQARDYAKWWVRRMIETPRPMQEKLVLLWHDHFATRYRNVNDSYKMIQQLALFRREANGNFGDLARGIVRDPAMLVFLNNNQNRARNPNENLARELMELFTLGEGHYTEHDIQQAARALTGYFVDDHDFAFRKNQHDDGVKTILGRRGAFDGESLVEVLLRQTACARFVAYKLYEAFVADLPDPDNVPDSAGVVIERLSQILRRENYELKPVLGVLLRSRHFHDAAVVGRRIKNPVEFVIGMNRSLTPPPRDANLMVQAMAEMGQQLLDPPNVSGWRSGRAWISTSTLFVRHNTAIYLITGSQPHRGGRIAMSAALDPASLLGDMTRPTPPAIVDRVVRLMLPRPLDPARRRMLLDFAEREKPASRDALVGLMLLVTTMPEFQMC